MNSLARRKLAQRPGQTGAQKFTAFFTRYCRRGKRDTGRALEDVELDEPSSRAAGRRHPWTIVHSFYANMGGFVFDTSDEDINFLPNSRQRLTLTPRGLLFLLENEPDLVPDISEEHIRDKSKASSLAKTLVCLQALWFCAQCIARCAQGLAVSLLELNVFAHAICSLLMYFLWWDKPMDIEEPTVLSGKMVRELCALMCMRSFLNYEEQCELPHGVRFGSSHQRSIAETSVSPVDKNEDPWYRLCQCCISITIGPYIELYLDLKALRTRQPRPTSWPLQCRVEWIANGPVDEQVENPSQATSYPIELNCQDDAVGSEDRTTTASLPSALALASNRVVHVPLNADTRGNQPPPPTQPFTTNSVDGLCLTLGRWSRPKTDANVFIPRCPKPDYAPASVTLSSPDVMRWRLCARALQRYCPEPEWSLISGTPSHQEFPAYRSVCDRSANWPSSQHLELDKQHRVESPLGILLGFSFAGLVYGGIHLLAWSAPFPSHTALTLWRSSGVLLALSGFICAIFLAWVILIGSAFNWIEDDGDHQHTLLSRILSFFPIKPVMIPGLVCAWAYLAARGYLVVESFLQLAHLPDSAYALPAWSQYYPHIT